MKMTDFEKIKLILNFISHKNQVIFAIYCAESVVKNLDKNVKETAVKAIEAAQAWLKEDNKKTQDAVDATAASVSAAYNAASSATYAASYAAYAASYAGYAAFSSVSAASYAAYAAFSSVSAASYAAYAAYAASSSAYAASSAENVKKDLHKIQLQFLIKLVELTKLEKLILNIKETQ
jgi:hypothetical protein